MKKLLFVLFGLGLSVAGFAQKLVPEIKKGTVLSSSAFVDGQQFPLQLTIKSMSGPVSIGWTVDGYGDGSFDMSDKALESANKMALVSQPALGVTKLADDETFGIISKAAFKSLVDTKSVNYNGIKFNVKTGAESAIKLDGKEVDAIHFVSETGKLEFWVLNNPAFPVILQSVGMPTDIVVNSIK